MLGRGTLGAALVACLVACGGESGSSGADMPATKEDAARRLMEVTNAGDVGVQMLEQMGGLYEMQFGPEFAEFWDEFSKRVDADELTELVVPIYTKHFELSELHELIRFNSTPVGQKLVRLMPEITRESMETGSVWGQELAAEAMAEYEARQDR